MTKINLTKKELQIINNILNNYPYHFYAFGSRVTGKNTPYSDLDVCYKENIPKSIIGKLICAFEESDLPFKVDIVDWNTCSEEFQQLITKDLTPLC